MRSNNALQVIFAFFLGLVVVAFVAIGVNTFYPEPDWSSAPYTYATWRLATGIVLLVCATLVLVISLLMPEAQGVLSNGVLLGGVFTMVYAVGVALSTDRSVLRFIVVAVALAVTIGVGYLKFVRGRRRAPVVAPDAPSAATGAPSGTVPAGAPEAVVAQLSARLSAVEHKLDALARALQG